MASSAHSGPTEEHRPLEAPRAGGSVEGFHPHVSHPPPLFPTRGSIGQHASEQVTDAPQKGGRIPPSMSRRWMRPTQSASLLPLSTTIQLPGTGILIVAQDERLRASPTSHCVSSLLLFLAAPSTSSSCAILPIQTVPAALMDVTADSGLAPPKDFSAYISRISKNRVPSKMKAFYKYFLIPGIGNLAGGKWVSMHVARQTERQQAYPTRTTSHTTLSRQALPCPIVSSLRPTIRSTLPPSPASHCSSQKTQRPPESSSLTTHTSRMSSGRSTSQRLCSMAQPKAIHRSTTSFESSPETIFTPTSHIKAAPRSY